MPTGVFVLGCNSLMSSSAQIAANRANAQHSTGPVTPEGQAAVGQNNFRHGFTGRFKVLPQEDQGEFEFLYGSLRFEHRPDTEFEKQLVFKMAQHYWLAQRAMRMQEAWMNAETRPANHEKHLALLLRYQTTHDRAFHKCSDELRKLRNQKRKLAIGFESQKRREAEETRKQAKENRAQDKHKWDILLVEAKIDHQHVLSSIANHPLMAAKIAEKERAKAGKAA